VQPARQVLCFLTCLRKKAAQKPLGLAKIKELVKRKYKWCDNTFSSVIASDQRERGNPWEIQTNVVFVPLKQKSL
jgi:hypothetical protein